MPAALFPLCVHKIYYDSMTTVYNGKIGLLSLSKTKQREF